MVDKQFPIKRKMLCKGIILAERHFPKNTQRWLEPCLAQYCKDILTASALGKLSRVPLPYSYAGELYSRGDDYPPTLWYESLSGCKGEDFVEELSTIDLTKWDAKKAEELYTIYKPKTKTSKQPLPELDAREIEQEG